MCGSDDVRERLAAIDQNVMNGLTPFQQATVKHIEHLYANNHNRILVADEVGLGKTLIARGVTSKIALLRAKENDDLVKVVYVCSNASIAAQNISRLRIDGDIKLSSADSSRLSMQHLKLARERNDEQLKRRFIQITPLTPATSFSINAGTGTMHERALTLAVLAYDSRLSKESTRYDRLCELMWDKRSNSNPESWKWWIQHTEGEVQRTRANERGHGIEPGYPFDVLERVERELETAGTTTIEKLCSYLDSGATNKPQEHRIINDLRRAFAKACVDMLDPDFVIMDEFQRFRSLIAKDDSETALLAKRFLSGHTRVLLLSATPFRMYSTDAELDTGGFGDSYHEFLEVMDFLGGNNDSAHEQFSRTWGDYTLSLKSLEHTGFDIVSILNAKNAAESLAREHIARTERQSTKELGPIADNHTHVRRLDVTADDVRAFVKMRRLIRNADIHRGLMSADYVKSCPFPLSFMSGYKLFKELEEKSTKKTQSH